MFYRVALAALFAAAVSAQVPIATVVGTRSPHVQGVIPSCSPGVSATGDAFVCYKSQNAYYLASMTSAGTTLLLSTTSAPYTQQPIVALGNVAILYDILHTRSFYAVATPTSCERPIDRHGITAGVVAIGSTAVVPLGLSAIEGYKDAVQFLTLASNGTVTPTNEVPLAYNDVDGTAVVSPVVWNSKVVMMVRDNLLLIGPQGNVLYNISNPCGHVFTPVNGIAVVDFNHKGAAVSMIIVHGSTGTAQEEQYTFCSINPFTFDPAGTWSTPYPDLIDVDDIVGSAGIILISGTVVSAHTLITWSIDAFQGTHLSVISRHPVDIYAWPRFLPNGISGCTGTFVMQSGGVVSAYCTDTMQAVWTSSYKCSHRAALDVQANRLVCTDWGVALTMLDFDGTVIWHDTRVRAEYQPELRNGQVFATDSAATMWVLGYEPASPTPAPNGEGLTGGEVFLIIFGVLVVAGSVVGATIYYKRAVRRQPTPMRVDAEGYGSLTT